MSHEPDQMPDRWILGAYRQLDSVAPPARLDAAILDAAATACGRAARTGQRPWWIWPVSMAAGLMLTIGVFFQIDQLLPRPTVVVLDPPRPTEARPAQRIGSPALPEIGRQAEVIDSSMLDRPPPAGAPAAGVRVRDHSVALEAAARNGDIAGAQAILERVNESGGTLQVSDDTQTWLRNVGLGELLPAQ